jgi:hypothetical protein
MEKGKTMRITDADMLFYKLANTDPNTEGRFCDGVATAMSFVLNAPTIDAVPVVHAHWEKVGKHDWQCSACKIGVPYSFTGFHYCHNCGAKMDER